MADNLTGAVIEVWAADATLAALVPGGLVREEYDPGAPLPHAALFDDGGTQDVFSEGDMIEAGRLRLEVYAARAAAAPAGSPGEAAEAVNAILGRAKAVFNAGTLDLDGWDHYQLRCLDRGRLVAERARSPEGERVYRGTLGLYAAASKAHP